MQSLPYAILTLNRRQITLFANPVALKYLQLNSANDAFNLIDSYHWVNNRGETIIADQHPINTHINYGKPVLNEIIGFKPEKEDEINWIKAHCSGI